MVLPLGLVTIRSLLHLLPQTLPSHLKLSKPLVFPGYQGAHFMSYRRLQEGPHWILEKELAIYKGTLHSRVSILQSEYLFLAVLASLSAIRSHLSRQRTATTTTKIWALTLGLN